MFVTSTVLLYSGYIKDMDWFNVAATFIIGEVIQKKIVGTKPQEFSSLSEEFKVFLKKILKGRKFHVWIIATWLLIDENAVMSPEVWSYASMVWIGARKYNKIKGDQDLSVFLEELNNSKKEKNS